MTDTDLTPIAFQCPRCGSEVEARFWGPCRACVAQLRSTMTVAAETVETEYIPKMNVTPNAVALKDD
ncbi:MAG: hypothetical protein JWL73_1164 [Actinomycetia bacterium]|nr:hypothetical protein [Actinomycetes bacterium]